MKIKNKKVSLSIAKVGLFFLTMLCLSSMGLMAQETKEEAKKPEYARNTFDGNLIIDNQTVMVPIKGTFTADIQHRFGTINNGYEDMIGLFAPSNIRLGVGYVPINKIQLGVGLTKERLMWDFNLKVALLKQLEKGGLPISISYFGNFVVDTRADKYFVKDGDRLSYFNQLIIASKINRKLSLQIAPSYTHYNNVEGYLSSDGSIKNKMENEHFAVAFSGRYKVMGEMGILFNYDQPLTQHPTNNPKPNISFGVDFLTTAHSFQIFFGNFQSIVPQANNFFNQNDFTTSRYLVGFNISRIWN
ncbi:MAG: DUF5777 family beta-barrel protein [Bacteroidia bacterium]|nr:DUF5777 family beta-barrel protein [Bacteroidia bacterium]